MSIANCIDDYCSVGQPMVFTAGISAASLAIDKRVCKWRIQSKLQTNRA